ncbi:MAG: hypothetical protein RL654_735 [Pseudomonadota bacterium]|jgi:hypothetical protein
MSTPTVRIAPCRGLALIEVLVALLLLGLGGLSLLRLQGGLRLGADLGHQQAEATRRATDELETLRADTAAPIPTATDEPTSPMRLNRRIEPGTLQMLQAVSSRVDWSDRFGQPRSLELASLKLRPQADLAAATLLARGGGRAGAMTSVGMTTAPRLPPGSQDLGDGRHAWRTRPDAARIWVFDSRSATVTQRCDLPAPGTPERLVAGHLGNCQALSGLLLSGHVRFATGTDTPGEIQAEQPDSAALPLGLRLTLSSTGHPSPAWDCVHDGPDGHSSGGMPDPLRTSIAYHCLVQPVAPASGGQPRWSGRLDLMPSGWLLAEGSGAAGTVGRFRICRYSADQDGNGRIDNVEHPAAYSAVTLPLAGQNFLVIRGSARCPADTGPWPWPDPLDDSTVAHQP